MRIALVAPLVAAIREPQRGGSQAFVSDLARGLIDRGHEVHLYAASGSEVPGVPLIDAGIDPGALRATLYRASGAAGDETAAEGAFASVYSAVRDHQYEVVHNHAFDAPAISLATSLDAPVVHTLHLPPDEAVGAALREAGRDAAPPTVAGVSAFQANAWRRAVTVDAILSPLVPMELVRWSPAKAEGAGLRRSAEPGEGSRRGHRDRPGRRARDRRLRRRL